MTRPKKRTKHAYEYRRFLHRILDHAVMGKDVKIVSHYVNGKPPFRRLIRVMLPNSSTTIWDIDASATGFVDLVPAHEAVQLVREYYFRIGYPHAVLYGDAAFGQSDHKEQP